MCSICGEINFLSPPKAPIEEMNRVLKHRGPDASGDFYDSYAVFGHNRLAVVDPEGGAQPMSVIYGNKKYTIVYNGEIYNTKEIRQEIEKQGIKFMTNSDTEVVLFAYIIYGEDAPKMLNGIFAFVVYDGEKAFLARDRFGVKPLYYAQIGTSLYFASEIKSLLKLDNISRDMTKESLWEILYLSPNFVEGKSPFRDILEIKPAECARYDKYGLKKWKYWQIEARPYFKDRDYAIEKTEFFYFDNSLKFFTVKNLHKGLNYITMKTSIDHHRTLENCFLLGDFGVEIHGFALHMTAAVKKLTYGDWCTQRLPFYSGAVDYVIHIPAGKKRRLNIDFQGSYAVILENTDRFWHEKNALYIPDGITEITLRIYGSRRNSHGPFHVVQQLKYCNPASFCPIREEYHPHWQLTEYCIFKVNNNPQNTGEEK